MSGGVGVATMSGLQELIKQDDTAIADPDHDREKLSLALFTILMVCVGFLIIGLVGIVSNSLLVHGANKVI